MKKVFTQTGRHICIFFTFTMAVILVAGYVFAGPSSGLNLTASIFGFSISFALLQAIWFTEVVFKKLSYPGRIAGFGVCGLPAISVCAWTGNWLPVDLISAWVTFMIIYLIFLAIMTTIYTIYFKKTVGSYEQALASYHDKQKK